MLGRRVAALVDQGNNPLAQLAATLKTSEFAILNLECPLLPSGNLRDAKAPLAAPAKSVELLKELGVDVVTLANNHSLDRGEKGLKETVSLLDASGIQHCGSGVSAEDALQPLRAEVQGRRIALFSIYDDEAAPVPAKGSGPRIATTSANEAFVKVLSSFHDKVDLVIVMPHWGLEHSQAPTERQRLLAASWLDAGAHLIVGTGPHVVQPLEHPMGSSVAWSLGNLVFDGPGPTREWSRGALLKVTWDAESMRMLRAQMIPVQIDDDGRVGLVEGR